MEIERVQVVETTEGAVTVETVDTVIFSVVDALEFRFTAAEGLIAAQEYRKRVHAKKGECCGLFACKEDSILFFKGKLLTDY